MQRKTTKEFISDARKVHGDKFDYSKVEYVNQNTKVCIVDKVYGDFWMTPKNHLKGQNHPEEKRIKRKARLVYGVGINDSNDRVRINGKDTKSYAIWRGILQRCYSSKWTESHPSYIGCTVCNEWKIYSRFKDWFDKNYVEGYDLDKDLLGGNLKQYSPLTCVFLPHEINTLLICGSRNSRLKTGAYKRGGGYQALIHVNGQTKHIGFYRTEDEAHNAYVLAKKEHIRNKAKISYEGGEIDQRVYEALLNHPIPEY